MVILHANDAIYIQRQSFGEYEFANGVDAAVMGNQRLNWCAEIIFAMVYSAETILLHRQFPFSLSASHSLFYRAIFR